jgi:hypothetical protein
MRTTLALAVVFVFIAIAVRPLRADETPVKSKIVAVSLFKNGLAVVKRDVTLGKPGVYVLEDVPQPVHGTYWVETNGSIETTVKMRDVEVPAEETVPGNLQEDLAGKTVTIHLKGDKVPPIVGTMLKLKKPKTEEGAGPSAPSPYTVEIAGAARYLVVQTAKGRVYLESSEVAYIEAEKPDEKVKRQKPRLLLTLGDTDRAETKATITYLTRGMSWAPSYKVDISDPKTLTLEQQAVVKNELADIDGAEVKLISGFPSVQFAHVLSPLSARTSWAAFFQELNTRSILENSITGNSVMAQQGFNNGSRSPYALSLSATPAGEGVDLHYQSIGKRTLAEGDSLALTVAKGKAAYERIVEWLVPDTRNEYGQHTGRGGDEDGDDVAWDALKFKNPLSFPMTTGPALVTADGKFNGQRSTFWVNTGEETVLRVDKALSIRTRAVEHEEVKNAGDGRDYVWVGGRQYRKSTVEGELAISNHRAEAIQMVVRRRFSGELTEADGGPKASLREEGVYSVNKRNELLWNLPLKSGEEKKLKYRYTVLVAN